MMTLEKQMEFADGAGANGAMVAADGVDADASTIASTLAGAEIMVGPPIAMPVAKNCWWRGW